MCKVCKYQNLNLNNNFERKFTNQGYVFSSLSNENDCSWSKNECYMKMPTELHYFLQNGDFFFQVLSSMPSKLSADIGFFLLVKMQ